MTFYPFSFSILFHFSSFVAHTKHYISLTITPFFFFMTKMQQVQIEPTPKYNNPYVPFNEAKHTHQKVIKYKDDCKSKSNSFRFLVFKINKVLCQKMSHTFDMNQLHINITHIVQGCTASSSFSYTCLPVKSSTCSTIYPSNSDAYIHLFYTIKY